MKKRLVIGIVIATYSLATVVAVFAQNRKLPPPPSKEFIEGFNAGVRFGRIAAISDPNIKDMDTLTEEAKIWYFNIVIDREGFINRVMSGQTNIAKTNRPPVK